MAALRDDPRATDPDMGPTGAAEGTRPCPKCATPSPVDFVFCGACGARMEQAAAAAPAPIAPRRRLLLIRPDGSEGGQFPLRDGENVVGRSAGAPFETDSFLSPRHAVLMLGVDRLSIRDLDSLNGVFVKLRREVELISGDVFRIGQELLRFDEIGGPRTMADGTEVMGSPNPGFWGRLTVMVGRNVDGNSYPLLGPQVLLGRERGDILFSEDGYVSGTHAKLSVREGRVFLADLGSSNGSFLRIRQETPLGTGDFVLLGQQLFRVDPM
jgi:pSer/pThr/pTyr-binding forkhead associated (FHA) protein